MVAVRKTRSGSAAGRSPQGTPWSFEWATDGAILDVPHDVAVDLLSIADGDYEIVPDEVSREISEPASPAGEVTEPGIHDAEPEIEDEVLQLTEPAPAVSEIAETPAAKTSRAGRPRKTAAE